MFGLSRKSVGNTTPLNMTKKNSRHSSLGRTSCFTLGFLALQTGMDLHTLAREQRTDHWNGLEKKESQIYTANKNKMM